MIPGKSFLDGESLSALQAKEKAQFIAFAPVVFKVTLALRNLGILRAVEAATDGITFDELKQQVDVSEYALRVLVDGGARAGLIHNQGDRLTLSSTGYFLLNDPMTTVNLDFINDVCYRGLDRLEASVASGRPQGLQEFGGWPTIYEGLARLPEHVRRSWLAFDHFYSDDGFHPVLPIVFEEPPARLLDIGGNTGKFSLECLRHDPHVNVTIMDLPGQLQLARQNVGSHGRIQFLAADLLDPQVRLPGGFDAIWMSQFLDCFSEAQIVAILGKCREVMGPNTKVYVLEPFTDRQRYDAAGFVLQMTSVYFTCMANGNSRMYSSREMERMAAAAGLELQRTVPNLGICQCLMIFTRRGEEKQKRFSSALDARVTASSDAARAGDPAAR